MYRIYSSSLKGNFFHRRSEQLTHWLRNAKIKSKSIFQWDLALIMRMLGNNVSRVSVCVGNNKTAYYHRSVCQLLRFLEFCREIAWWGLSHILNDLCVIFKTSLVTKWWNTLFVFYKNLVYKNIKPWNRSKIKNVVVILPVAISF